MRLLVVDTDYPEFLHWLYEKQPGLEGHSYEEQLAARQESLFGIAHFYSLNLRKLGHEAWDVYANNLFMQMAWAREHGIRFRSESVLKVGLPRLAPWVDRLARNESPSPRYQPRSVRAAPWAARVLREKWSDRVLARILTAQVRRFAPDVLLNQAMDRVGSSIIRKVKPHAGMVVGQIAAPLPQDDDLRCYDLVISSLPNIVDYFRRRRIPSELSRLAFEPTILDRLDGGAKEIDVSFVGSLSPHHRKRVRWLEHLCRRLRLQVWGPGVDSLPADSPIHGHHKGVAWGLDMYRILQASKITLNQHVDIAGPYANNLRLFEATGVGTLLVTDWKENLHELFDPGREVVAYRNSDDYVSLVQRYLENEEERKAVARAGQRRTLSEHTYENRARELVRILQQYS